MMTDCLAHRPGRRETLVVYESAGRNVDGRVFHVLTLSESIGLEGKCAIVAGGGAAGDGIGNGRAAAILLARAGAEVFVVDRKLALASRTAAMIGEEGGTAHAYKADLTKEAECDAMVAAAVSRFGRLDILDNNIELAATHR